MVRNPGRFVENHLAGHGLFDILDKDIVNPFRFFGQAGKRIDRVRITRHNIARNRIGTARWINLGTAVRTV